MRAWLAALTDEQLARSIVTQESGGQPLWAYLVHLVSHAIQQFADAATILHVRGASPGGIEFLDYVQARGGIAS